MTIREAINILMDAPNKDNKIEVEIDTTKIKKDDFDWHQLKITQIINCGYASIITAEEQN